jgi:hypothetical protein
VFAMTRAPRRHGRCFELFGLGAQTDLAPNMGLSPVRGRGRADQLREPAGLVAAMVSAAPGAGPHAR